MRVLQDDLIRITQIGIESRRRLAARIRREHKARRMEIASGILAVSGTLTTAAACLCVETSDMACIIGGLTGFALITAAAVIDIINAQEEARWRKS